MKKRTILITKGFGTNLDDVIGHIELYAADDIADILFTDTMLVQHVLAPAYVQHEDGTIELTEFSLIPAPQAAGLIERGIDNAKAY